MKRILGFVLALSMIIAMVPAVAADNTTGLTLKYDISSVMEAQSMSSSNYATKPLTLINEETTKGFFSFAGTVADMFYGDNMKYRAYGLEFYTSVAPAFELYIPRAGKYTMNVYANRGGDGRVVNVYMTKSTASIDAVNKIGEYDCNKTETDTIFGDERYVLQTVVNGSADAVINITEPGSYVFTFHASSMWATLGGIELIDGLGTMVVPMSVKLAISGDQASIEKVVMSDGTTTNDGATVTYSSSDPSVAAVDENTGVITKVGEGTTDITVSVKREDVTVTDTATYTVEADTELKNAFDAVPEEKTDYIPPSVTGITVGGNVIAPDANGDGSYNLTAPETKEESKFLYWAMGMGINKRIVSFEETLKNYVPEGNSVNYLVPVYANDITDTIPEYYNLNGQLIKKSATEPELPEIPGLGKAERWVNCEGTNVWVAEYKTTTPGNVTVTVDGKEQNVPYGTEITCTANSDNFKCWKKTVGNTTEIVSVSSTYKFRAWEDTAVTSEYAVHVPVSAAMKIIIDDFDVDGATGVMAEFIGLENAVEKGIMFTAKNETAARKIAMTSTDNQFTVIADEEGTYVGYAILKSGENLYKLLTDGSYTK